MTDMIDDRWSAGVQCDDPDYPRAAARLIYRWIEAQQDPPGNVAAAAGYLLGYVNRISRPHLKELEWHFEPDELKP